MAEAAERVALYREALDRCLALAAAWPDLPTLPSVIAQLRYLLALETGAETDRSRLADIVLGVQAAREIEPLDLATADLLHAVNSARPRA